jgi:hypothetical protein
MKPSRSRQAGGNTMETRELPLGNPNFQEIREKGQYYVDKTPMIEEFLRSGDKVTLITRPRRFGKTLNMSMLSCFCDQDMDSRCYFEGLSIMNTDYSVQMNSFPVIYISFKDAKQNDYVSLLFDIYMHISMLYYEYREIYTFLESHKESFSDPAYKNFYSIFQYFEQIDDTAEQEAIFTIPAKKSVFIKNLSTSLLALTKAVATYYNKKPILLIDEYDTPQNC